MDAVAPPFPSRTWAFAGRSLALAVVCSALSGCAVVRPPTTVQNQSWPEPTTTHASAGAGAGAAPSSEPGGGTGRARVPTASASTLPVATISRQGFTVPVPVGYADVTSGATAAPAGGPTRLIAHLRNAAGETITVQTAVVDRSDLASYLASYVPALKAGGQATVTGQRAASVAALDGVELTLTGAGAGAGAGAGGGSSTLFLAMPSPGNTIQVTGVTPDEAHRQAVEQVARGLRFS